MKLQNSHNKILEYLDKYGPVNTFRLSKGLKIDRGKLISLLEELTNEGLTIFRSGTVTKGDKELIDQKVTEGNEAEKEKPISKPIPTKTLKKSKILKEKQSELEKVKERIKRLKDDWLRKEGGLKKEIEDLQTQRNNVAQKLTKERTLLYQVRKEKKGAEKNLVEWEKSLKQREEVVQKREKSVSTARRRLKKEREKLKEKKIKPRAIAKKIKPVSKPKIEKPEKMGVSKTENKQPEMIAKKPWSQAIETKENVYYRLHNLIEQEIILLKQGRINEARDIHLKIKDMISTVTDTNQRKIIINDWNRIKEFY